MIIRCMTDENVGTVDPDGVLVPAASLVVLEETGAGLELLMLRRSPAMAFAPGALVFPGGRVDAGDTAFAARLSSGLAIEDAQRGSQPFAKPWRNAGCP